MKKITVLFCLLLTMLSLTGALAESVPARPGTAPSASPRATATDRPMPRTPTPPPSDRPAATATASLSVQPGATLTPVPTVRPTATASPEPTATPTVEPTATPEPRPTDTDGTLRVWLKSLGSMKSTSMTLTGSYTLSGDANMRFEDGGTLTATAAGDEVWLKCGPLALNMGEKAVLTRHKRSDGGVSGFKVSTSAMYCGSLKLTASDGQLKLILLIDVEDYLKGVVPSEMSDSFPIEALKAQAVAARTYALQRRSERRGKKEYDLVDTPADQAFKGYDPSCKNSAEAVEATRGLCGLYKGDYAVCYYTATNGGQTALAGDVLEDFEDRGYLDIHDDPYDLENTHSQVKTLAFNKNMSDAPEMLTRWLTDAAGEAAAALGYSDEAENMRVSAITGMTLSNPKGGEPNRMYETLTVSYTIEARRMEPIYAPVAVTERIFHVFTGRPVEQEIVGYGPGDWEAVEGEFECELSVYGQLKDELGLGLSTIDCEVTSVIEEEDTWIVQLRRYGHGVGMSQRGAQTMAGNYGMSCEEILAFYYPGLTFETLTLADETLPALNEAGILSGTVLAEDVGEGEYIATVALSTMWSTLNVRSAPSTDAPILWELVGGSQVIVESEKDGWAHVRTENVEGYVSAQYLKTDK